MSKLIDAFLRIKKSALEDTNFTPYTIDELDYKDRLEKSNAEVEKDSKIVMDELEIWELIKQYPDELGFVLQEKDYAMYCDTFSYEGTGDLGDIVLTEEQFNKIKNFFSKGE